MLVHYYAKVEGDWPVMVESLLVLEGGDIDPEDVELPSVPVPFEGVRGKDEEDEGKTFEQGELLELEAVLFFVEVEGSHLIGDLVVVFVCFVDVVG